MIKKIFKKFSSSLDYSYDTREFLSKTFDYERQLKDVIHEYNLINSKLKGFATPEYTELYSKRDKYNINSSHFKRTYDNLTVSSIGIGTYTGDPDDITDYYMYNSIKNAVLSGGINVIDTAINYRYMKSEKTIGKALQILVHKYKFNREEILLCSKIGFVPDDAETGNLGHTFVGELIEEGKMDFNEVIYSDNKRPIHCIHPEYLKSQLEHSLNNLNVETLDVLYLHNLYESQFMLPKELFITRLQKALETLELFRTEGKIRNYGIATWNSLRVDSSNTQHCNIQELVELAERVCGKENGFKYIQAPINIVNPEVFIEKFQEYKFEGELDNSNIRKEKKGVEEDAEAKGKTLGEFMNEPLKGEIKNDNKSKTYTTVTALCNKYSINLISSSPILQGALINLPLENSLFKVKHSVSKQLQLLRSIPAEALKCTLVGMKSQVHLKNNLEISQVSPLTPSEFYEVLAPKKRKPYVETSPI